MLQVSEKYEKQILADNRSLRLKVECLYSLQGEVIHTLQGDDCIISMELEEMVNSEDVITMGSACCGKLTLKLIQAASGLDYDHMILRAFSGLSLDDGQIEYVPLGIFYPSEVKSDGSCGSMTITAYDSMCLLEQPYAADHVGFPVKMEVIAREIAALADVTFAEDVTFADYEIDALPQELTLRQMIGYLAGLMGCFARFNRENKLEFSWYADTDVEITPKEQYLNGFVRTLDSPLTVTGIISGTEETSYSQGRGGFGVIVNFTNPFMKKTYLDDIWEDKIAEVTPVNFTAVYSGQLEESGFEAEYQGDGIWKAARDVDLCRGDILRVSDLSGWNLATDRVVVTSAGSRDFQLSDASGIPLQPDAEGEGETQTPSAVFTRLIQWVCEEPQSFSEEDILTQDGEQYVVSGIKKHDFVLLKADQSMLTDPAAGLTWSLQYRTAINYRMSYQPAELQWRGNPALQAGDVITAVDTEGNSYRIPIMSQTLTFDGGIVSKITAKGETTSDASFSSASPTVQRITKLYSDIQEAIRDVTGKLTGKNGGTVSFAYDDDGLPSEIYISNTKKIQPDSHVWRWNQNGLGFSANGLEGPFETAMTSDGKIVAGMIRSGSVAADVIDIEGVIETINASDGTRIDGTRVALKGKPLDRMIEASVSSTGGTNLIYNSTGHLVDNKFDGWITKEGAEPIIEIDSTNLISQRAFCITGPSYLKTTVPVTAGQMHTFSCRVKKPAAHSLQISLGKDMVFESREIIGDWELIHYEFVPDDKEMKLDIAVEAGKAYVGDLMLCVGAGTTWNQASNEVFGTNVKLTKDMLIIAPEDDRDQGVKTTIDPSGMKITDNRPGQNRIVEYDVNGVSVRRVISDGQVSSGKTSMIPIDQRNACMWIIRE